MMLYRVTEEILLVAEPCRIMGRTVITRRYYSTTKDEAIERYITEHGKDPLDFMLNLSKYVLITVEHLHNRNATYADAVVRFIEKLG